MVRFVCLLGCAAFGILVPRPGIEPVPSAESGFTILALVGIEDNGLPSLLL